jgi:hypothetical protein
MHCPPVSSHSRALLPARMPPPVTPALPVPPRDPIALGGTGAIWNLGGKLDTLRETREEDDLMEPDSPLEGFHSLVVERFEVRSFLPSYLRTVRAIRVTSSCVFCTGPSRVREAPRSVRRVRGTRPEPLSRHFAGGRVRLRRIGIARIRKWTRKRVWIRLWFTRRVRRVDHDGAPVTGVVGDEGAGAANRRR